MKNVKELNLIIGEKYTVLKTDELVPLRICGILKGYHFDKWAQYENCLYIYIQRPRVKRVDEIIISIEKCFIFKGDFKEIHRKEVIKDTKTITHSLLHRWTYNDLKDDKTLVYYHDFKEEFNVNDNFDCFIDVTADYLINNNIKGYEAGINENYISYIKSLLVKYNVNTLKEYVKNEGYVSLINNINKAVEYKLY
jgi:hypothetical protein